MIRPVHGILTVCADHTPQDWTLQIPLSALVDLQGLPLRMHKLEAENEQLHKQIEALRLIQSQTLEKLADLMRERMKG